MAALVLVMGAGRALAADSFSGNYGGVCFGLTNATGPDQHYSYWAEYNVNDVTGMVAGTGQLSRQGGASPPQDLNVNTDHRLFRREGVVMGLGGTAENRVHGRLSDDLEYGLFTRLHDNNEWYLAMIAPKYEGVPIDDSYLESNYWFVQFGYFDIPGVGQGHRCAYGSEIYDGYGNVSTNFRVYLEGGSPGGYGSGSYNYYVASDGDLARYNIQEEGFILDYGLFLATSPVTYDDRWGITLSALKPTGTLSEADLQGPYWVAMLQYNNTGGADLHSVSLGEAYFNGAGGVDMWITSNVKGFGLTSGYVDQTYTVAADGAFTLGSTFNGGVGRYNRVVLAAQVHTENLWGIMVLVKRTGIEDPSPLGKLLGLTP